MTSHFGWAGRLALALFTVGCTHHYHDFYHNDYHRWDTNERVYYNQWVVENHRNTHRDYRHLSREDQKRCWDWRHNHDRNHDRDHDRDVTNASWVSSMLPVARRI
jgi:hypothetical protein